METFVGLKQIDAKFMTLGDYNTYRGWTIPEDKEPSTPGYLVRYPDGYESWSPEDQFDGAYMHTSYMDFSAAVFLMKRGHKVARAGWNGKGMWIIRVPGTLVAKLTPGTPYAKHLGDYTEIEILPHYDMYTVNADGRRAMLPGWLASQSDIDAKDWMVVE